MGITLDIDFNIKIHGMKKQPEGVVCHIIAMTFTAIQAWNMLRMPFVLSSHCIGHHTCKWECIDVDLAGCLVCGVVHDCGKKECRDVVTTSDSSVCTITGLCVTTKNFAVNEYSDNVVVFSCARNAIDVLEARMSRVVVSVQEFLTSQASRKVFAYEHSKRVSKFHISVARSIRNGDANLIQMIQGSIDIHNSKHFDLYKRQVLATTCAHNIKHAMCVAQVKFGLHVKDSELRTFVFGMIYLMCRGVHMHAVQILPHIPELRDILPSENNVVRFFNFRARHITETENKFKFAFRGASVEMLQALS